MEYTKAQLAQTYQNLPPQIKNAISEVDSLSVLKELGTAHDLHIDQIGQLADEVGLVVFGLSDFSKFSERIRAKLNIDHPRAEQITKAVNEQIFLKIREVLRRGQTQGDDQTTTAKSEQTPPSDIFEQKMGQMFNLPKEEGDFVDPYRETIK